MSDFNIELQQALTSLRAFNIYIDLSDHQQFKRAVKVYKSNKEVYLLLTKAHRLYSRCNQTNTLEITKETKRREQLSDVDRQIEDIIENWSTDEQKLFDSRSDLSLL